MQQIHARNPIEARYKSRGRVKKKFFKVTLGSEKREKEKKKEGGTAERRVFFGPAGLAQPAPGAQETTLDLDQ